MITLECFHAHKIGSTSKVHSTNDNKVLTKIKNCTDFFRNKQVLLLCTGCL